MRIAVIADTHDRFPPHVADAIGVADEIWHLGDVCLPAILHSISEIGPPVKVVRGNCDDCGDWPEVLSFEMEGFHVVLTHVPPRTIPRTTDLLLHGHTHVPRNELAGRTRILNPGCITRPNRGAPASFAWLELVQGGVPRWSLQRV